MYAVRQTRSPTPKPPTACRVRPAPPRSCLLTDPRALASAHSTFRSQALSFVFVSDFATTVSGARVAGLAGVTRAAVSQWRTRHADFPAPVAGDSDRFDLNDVIGWLDGRPIPASGRAPDEAAGTTYGNRVRRRLRPAGHPDADLLFRSLLALGPEVCGDAPRGDYLYLLVCLAFLRVHDQDRWAQLTRAVPRIGRPRRRAAAAAACRCRSRRVARLPGPAQAPGCPAGPAAAACF